MLRGPASFSVNDECGLLVDGFDTPPTLMMPHNPRYYVDLIERAGFTKAKDLWVYQGGRPDQYVPVPERLARGTELIRQRLGITLRALDMKNFEGEVSRIKELYNAAWEKNWGFVPMTEHEIDHLAEQFKPVVIPELVPFAEKDGKLVGFGIVLPDLNVVFRTNRSGRLFPMILRLLWALKTRKIRRAASCSWASPPSSGARAWMPCCITGSGPSRASARSTGAKRGGFSRTTPR